MRKHVSREYFAESLTCATVKGRKNRSNAAFNLSLSLLNASIYLCFCKNVCFICCSKISDVTDSSATFSIIEDEEKLRYIHDVRLLLTFAETVFIFISFILQQQASGEPNKQPPLVVFKANNKQCNKLCNKTVSLQSVCVCVCVRSYDNDIIGWQWNT